MASQAEEQWVLAQKWRHAVIKETDTLREDSSDGTELARFEKVESHLAQYRLACIQAILGDIKFATEKRMELDLWQTHILINNVYRKVLNRLSSTHQKVAKRKVDGLYQHFLKVAQEFYRGYLQRICARYGINELTRSLYRLKLAEMDLPKESQVDARATGIREEVVSSCHQTLICLGDLARYRTFQRPAEKRNWANALTAYDLAIGLRPDSGFGHHQTGLIFLETKDYFKAVYHMYRAMVCDRPHELAAGNLNRGFKEVLKSDASTDKKSWTETMTMTNWFVKLHARFSKGEERKSYDEMEEEVLHRFGRSLKVDGDDMLRDALLKMIVTNIAAYYAMVKKTIDVWSEAGSRSCEHLLRWNIRAIYSIARFLRAELMEYLATIADNATDNSSSTRCSNTISFGLALLGVYMTWLCTYSSDLVNFQAHLEPHFGDMGKTLAQTLTLVLDLVYQALKPDNGAFVPFRLVEEEETLGLKCLDGSSLPERCRLQHDPLTGVLKIHKADYDGEYTEEQILVTRAAHISCCAVHLGSDSKFPFLYSTMMKNSKPESTVVFLEEGKPLVAAAVSDATVSPAQVLVTSSPARDADAIPAPLEPSTSEPPMDDQVFSMVNEFLVPPESPRTAASAQGQNELPQSPSLLAPRRVSSTTPAQYPNLPWNFFYTPSPIAPPGQNLQTLSSDHALPALAGYQGPPQPQYATGMNEYAALAPRRVVSPMHSPFSPYQLNIGAAESLLHPGHLSDSFQHQVSRNSFSEASPRGQLWQEPGGESPHLGPGFRPGSAQRPMSQGALAGASSGLQSASGLQRMRASESLHVPALRTDFPNVTVTDSNPFNNRNHHPTRQQRRSQNLHGASHNEFAPARKNEQTEGRQVSLSVRQPSGYASSSTANAAVDMIPPTSLVQRRGHGAQGATAPSDERFLNQPSLYSGGDTSNIFSSLDSEQRREFLINALKRNMGGDGQSSQPEQMSQAEAFSKRR